MSGGSKVLRTTRPFARCRTRSLLGQIPPLGAQLLACLPGTWPFLTRMNHEQRRIGLHIEPRWPVQRNPLPVQ